MIFKKPPDKRVKSPVEPNIFQMGDIVNIEDFGKFRFKVGKICQGGMGIVYQLLSIDSHFRTIAAKTFLDGNDQNTFEREAENWFLLGEYPFIVKPMWYGKWYNKYCIIMDWYDKNLSDLNALSLSSEDVLKIISAIVEGLEYAHGRLGLIHQDIKPSNILIESNNNPRIADFGLSIINPTVSKLGGYSSIMRDARTTISYGDIGGTPFYMDPELLIGRTKPSFLTDIYSLGVTLYEWLTHEHPYLGPETNFKFVPTLREKPLHNVSRHFGMSFKSGIEIILSSLNLSPSKRPSSYSLILSTIGKKVKQQPTNISLEPHEVQKLVLIYRSKGEFDRAEGLLKRAIKFHSDDPLLYNAYARLMLTKEDRFDEAFDLFRKGFECLKTTKGFYNGKPYLDPAMNLAKGLIVSQEYESAEQILSTCWKWADNGKDERFLWYEEFGWYLLYIGNPQNAGDILLYVSKSRGLDNYALRWFTLASFWANALRVLAPIISKLWLQADMNYEMFDALAMALCALYTPPPLRKSIWAIIDGQFSESFRKIAKEQGSKDDWYKWDYEGHAELLAELLDLGTTGGTYCGLANDKIGNSRQAIRDYGKAIELDPKDAEAYYGRGCAYANLEDYRQAIRDYDKAIELDPKYAHAYFNRGIAYSKLGDYRQTIMDFDKAIELDPKNAKAYYGRAVAYANLEDYRQATRDYDKAIELDPKDANAYCNRGIAYGKLGDYRQEIRDYDKAIELDPKDANAHYNRGISYANLEDYRQATRDYDKAIELDPKYAHAYFSRGLSYADLGDYRQAIRDFDKGIELDPEDALAYYKRGIAYGKLRDYRRAIEDYDKAVELKPKYAVAYYKRGVAHANLEDHRQAIRDYDKAIELDPKDAVAYCDRGLAYANLEDYRQAIRDYNKAIELDPKDADAYCKRGVCHARLGDNQQAIRDYDKAIEFDPNLGLAYLNRGVSYADLEDYRQAISDYDKAIESDPKDAKAYTGRGIAYGKLGDNRQAIRDYDKAIELDPNYSSAYLNRGNAYLYLGDFRQATEDIKIAARLGLKEAQDILRKEGIGW